jgi:predicted glutamine amidotransferase
MCVILVCPANVRPDRMTLDACHEANPHGAGVAWREDGEVRWFKGLEPDELEPLIAGLKGEIVIHFRWASVGEVTPKLCHPFPVSSKATIRLSGHARAVLFHNGTWGQWRETLRRMPKHRTPDGLLSDSRVAASLVDLCGVTVLDRLPGRYVFFERDFTELYGDWRDWRGMRVSNLGFTCGLSKPALFAPKYTQSADSSHQALLDFPDTCGNPDT